MMIMKIILWASIIWLAPLVCFLLRNEAKFKKNIVVGVTIPYNSRNKQEVVNILEKFKKNQVFICIFLLVLAIPCFFFKEFLTIMTSWIIWLYICIILPYIPYIKTNKALKEVKNKNGWNAMALETSKKIIVDTALIPNYPILSPWIFIIPLMLSLIPIIFDHDYLVAYIVDSLSIVMFWFCYKYLYRNKAEKVDENEGLTKTLSRVRRHNFGTMWIISSYFMVALNFTLWLTMNNPIISIILIVAITLILTYFILRIELKTRKVQEKLTKESGVYAYVDDDDKWIWGLFYYNPYDSKLIINNRVGMNTSVNLAKPLGKVLTGLSLILMLSMLMIIPIIGISSKQPIEINISSTSLNATNGMTDYEIPLDEITDVTLLDELPRNLRRTNGTRMDNLLKGNFSSKELGPMRVILDPNYTNFILLTTEQDKTYLLGTRDDTETIKIYEKLEKGL